MSVLAERVTVGTTATEIVEADIDGAAFSIRNRGSESVFIGGLGVTTSDGYELGVGEAVGVQLNQGDILYADSASGGQRVDVLRVG